LHPPTCRKRPEQSTVVWVVVRQPGVDRLLNAALHLSIEREDGSGSGLGALRKVEFQRTQIDI
jgi:hypothetical protein